MSVKLGDVFIAIMADDKPLDQGFDRAERKSMGWATALGERLKGAVGGALMAVAATGAAAIAGVGVAAGKAALDGLGLSSSLEQVEARLVAFTKDGEAAKKILAEIRQEAALTPFGVMELSRATSALLPVARSIQVPYMDLVRLAEQLAAFNPAQGLEGAAYALREAVGGDFMSIIDRFDLPRQTIKRLREEGLSNVEAVQAAMKEMGINASLVGGMAQTAAGRWSTLKDSIDSVKVSFANPLFELGKRSLERLQVVLDANILRLQELATLGGTRLANTLGRTLDWLSLVAVPRFEMAWSGLQRSLTAFQAGGGGLQGLLAALNVDPSTGAGILRFYDRLREGWGRVSRLLQDSGTTFRQAFAGEWVDSETIVPLHRLMGMLGNFAREATEKATEVIRAFGESGWRGALRALVPPDWARTIERAAEALGRFADAAYTKAQDVITALNQDGIGGVVRELLPDGWANMILDGAAALDEFVRERAMPWAKDVGEDAGGLFKKILDFLAANPEGVSDVIVGLGAALLTLGAAGAAQALLAGLATALAAVSIPLALVTVGVVAFAIAWKKNLFDIRGHTALFAENTRLVLSSLAHYLTVTVPAAIRTAGQLWAIWVYGMGNILQVGWNSTIKPTLDSITTALRLAFDLYNNLLQLTGRNPIPLPDWLTGGGAAASAPGGPGRRRATGSSAPQLPQQAGGKAPRGAEACYRVGQTCQGRRRSPLRRRFNCPPPRPSPSPRW